MCKQDFSKRIKCDRGHYIYQKVKYCTEFRIHGRCPGLIPYAESKKDACSDCAQNVPGMLDYAEDIPGWDSTTKIGLTSREQLLWVDGAYSLTGWLGTPFILPHETLNNDYQGDGKQEDRKRVDKKQVDKKRVDKKRVDKKQVDKKRVDKKQVGTQVKSRTAL
ncbi:hypothetical protein Vi05172_g11094 [Venturia inaequalis]|nr:hypothetical protein Vi05172_g11094 [Venturia inaequalis]